MYFDQDNNYYDDSVNISFDRNQKLYSPDEGFNKGNMFINEYSKYKDYAYKLKVSNDKDRLLYEIQMYTFALKDIILFLDTHPNYKAMLKKYNEYSNELKKLKERYEKTYGPLCSFNVKDTDSWTWINNPWPWDKGGKYNV